MSNEEARLIVFLVWLLIVPFADWGFSLVWLVILIIPACFLEYEGWDFVVYFFGLYLLVMLGGVVEIVVDWLRS